MKYACLGSIYSPFSDSSFQRRLEKFDLYRSDLLSADIILVRNLSLAKKAVWLFPLKRIAVWTNEPAYDATNTFEVKASLGKTIKVYNVFTNNVFWHNHHFLSSYHFIDTNDLGITRGRHLDVSQIMDEAKWKARKTAVAVFARKNIPEAGYHVGKLNVDANLKRQAIALVGHQRGMCDVAGYNWPDEISFEASGFDGSDDEPWWIRKIEMMGSYRFNIAIENNIWPYYVTEKIWQAISAGVLPIYWGSGSSIYESFPEKSFVDASRYATPDELWNAIEAMEYDEWSIRMKSCTIAFNAAMDSIVDKDKQHFDEVIERFLATINS